MSLSAILVPLAIGAIGTVVTSKKVPIDIVNNEDQLENLRKHTSNENSNFYKLETPIKQEDLLKEALQNYGSNVETATTNIDTVVGDTHISFIKEESGLYSAVFSEDIIQEDAEAFIHHIVEEYTTIVQQEVYKKLMTRAKEEGLVFESEEKHEEGLVLTFGVKE